MPTVDASFDTRRDAEMAVERLVQEFGIDRSAIMVAPEGSANSAGEELSGGDEAAEAPATDERDDAALNGRIKVTVELEDADKIEKVRAALAEFDAG